MHLYIKVTAVIVSRNLEILSEQGGAGDVALRFGALAALAESLASVWFPAPTWLLQAVWNEFPLS